MATTDSDTANYRGTLYLYGKSKAPFLSAISPRTQRSQSFTFPLASPWALEAATQDVQSEDTAAAAGTPVTTSVGQDSNVCQIMKKDVLVTYKKQSTNGQFSGINTNDPGEQLDALGFQKKAQLMQLASDIEYSFLQGTYEAESSSATEVATRGLKNAITTNTVAGGSAALSDDMFREVIRDMTDSGAPMENIVILCNMFQMQQLSDIYGYAPQDRNLGGVNINAIYVPGFNMPITPLYSPQMPTDEVYLADLSVCAPVFVPVVYQSDGQFQPENNMIDGVDVLFKPDSTTRGAANGGFFYTQVGLQYGPEEYHGSITGLATS